LRRCRSGCQEYTDPAHLSFGCLFRYPRNVRSRPQPGKLTTKKGSSGREGDEIEIICDARGVAVLPGVLAKVMAARSEHCHLRGRRGGGRDLDDVDPWGRKSVSEVIINYQGSGTC
jgi:hypothetical protein